MVSPDWRSNCSSKRRKHLYVRLVNSGFGSGEEWDGQYDGMAEGRLLFLENLRLHLEYFAGQAATASLPMAMWTVSRRLWASPTQALGIPAAPPKSARIELRGDHGLRLAGTVVETAPHRLALLVDEPAPGTAFLAVEGVGKQSGVSIWSYLYGADGAALAGRDTPRWQAWLDERTATPS